MANEGDGHTTGANRGVGGISLLIQSQVAELMFHLLPHPSHLPFAELLSVEPPLVQLWFQPTNPTILPGPV